MSAQQPAIIIRGPVSPYVRKVLAVCELKGVPYQVDPIVPFFGDDRFSELNPLRRIPVFVDDQVSVSDSTVIVTGLDMTTAVRDGKTLTNPGRVTFVIARRGAEWKIVHFHRSAVPGRAN